ncbi:N-acetylmuramoyl-L-alanine amidase [Planomicrobium koreense]|uniref:N-acetylmuramoyl-L-alanine amidase n=1 Tax=Planococcus koreensis TaxID=112331 RepID=A0A7W8CRY9_9BACL|nr:N-acetylmuramoyl-L-alanine amidase [Planococcus koreensis]MBB5179418.1 N-acetylmuramoyl-L-alanine amidase [Planococcus koreensis]
MKNLFMKVSLFLVAIVLVISSIGLSPTSAAVPFKDILSTDKEIIYLYDRGMIKGTSATTFSPDASVTREQAAVMIGRAFNFNSTPRKTSFTDVKSSSYSSGYIQEAVNRGIITGYGDGTFKPLQTMTRGEMAFLLSRAFNLTKTGNVFFTDIKVDTASTSLYTAVNKIATFGISNGTGTGTYAPNEDLNRRQFAAFLARGLNPNYRVVFQNASIDTLYVTVDSLNVRTGPSTGYTAVGKLNTGAKFTVYGYNGVWAYGTSGTISGYVHSSYLSKAVVSAEKRYIAIDAGHGGTDPGAVANGLREKDVNLDVAKRVEAYLKTKGISVYMTRSTDKTIALDQRVPLAVKSGANAFVSIHANSATPAASGSETFYSAALDENAIHSKQLATFIQNRLYKAMSHNNRGVKEAPYLVLRTNPMPAALVELGFLTNSSDAYKLSTVYYKDRAASAIASGIDDYYKWKANN